MSGKIFTNVMLVIITTLIFLGIVVQSCESQRIINAIDRHVVNYEN